MSFLFISLLEHFLEEHKLYVLFIIFFYIKVYFINLELNKSSVTKLKITVKRNIFFEMVLIYNCVKIDIQSPRKDQPFFNYWIISFSIFPTLYTFNVSFWKDRKIVWLSYNTILRFFFPICFVTIFDFID